MQFWSLSFFCVHLFSFAAVIRFLFYLPSSVLFLLYGCGIYRDHDGINENKKRKIPSTFHLTKNTFCFLFSCFSFLFVCLFAAFFFFLSLSLFNEVNKMGNYVLMSFRNNDTKQPRTVQTRPERQKDRKTAKERREPGRNEARNTSIIRSWPQLSL